MAPRPSLVASIIVRHAGAYAELIVSDLEAARRALVQRMLAGAIALAFALLAAQIACAWVIAAAWETAARHWVVGGLLLLCVAVAWMAFRRLRRLDSTASGVLARTALEWAKDRALLEEILERSRRETP